MTLFLTTLTIVFALVLLALYFRASRLSFAAQRPEDYAQTEPAFDMRRHLTGALTSEGVIYGPDGRVAGRFVARMEGKWTGDTGTLTEDFRYASGSTQMRKWHLTMGIDGSFTATADDVIGAAQGEISGATLRMTYRLRLEPDAGGHVLDVIDWLYLMEDGAIMNRSEMRKFGVRVAELVATMRPEVAD